MDNTEHKLITAYNAYIKADAELPRLVNHNEKHWYLLSEYNKKMRIVNMMEYWLERHRILGSEPVSNWQNDISRLIQEAAVIKISLPGVFKKCRCENCDCGEK